jgi:hypothetical protein
VHQSSKSIVDTKPSKQEEKTHNKSVVNNVK